MMRTTAVLATLLGAGVLFGNASAVAGAPTPHNDKRSDAQRIEGVPSRVAGTTVGAKAEESDPVSVCASFGPTVWYRLGGASGTTAVSLRALGQLEAIVAVYRVDRSHLTGLGCSKTDAHGLAGLAFPARPKKTYLVMVGQRTSSIPGKFDLAVQEREHPARPPGRSLPAGGAWSSVNRLTDPDDSWAVEMDAGTAYQINLVANSQRCLRFELYRSTIRTFRTDERVRYFGCDGYRTFTPGPDGGGTYTLRVIRDGKYRGSQNYRLEVAAAGPDDGAPGVALQSGATVSGTLSPRTIDVRDVYRVTAAGSSMLTATLDTSPVTRFDLLVLSDTGKPVHCECGGAGPLKLRHVVDQGYYYLAVLSPSGSSGSYKLGVLVREVTATQLLADGAKAIEVSPDHFVQLTASVAAPTGAPSTAAVGGNVRFQLDRLDLFSGWQFVELFPVPVASDGVARLSWAPPSVGHWRAHAVFFGTLTAAPSTTGYVKIDVAEPSAGL